MVLVIALPYELYCTFISYPIIVTDTQNGGRWSKLPYNTPYTHTTYTHHTPYTQKNIYTHTHTTYTHHTHTPYTHTPYVLTYPQIEFGFITIWGSFWDEVCKLNSSTGILGVNVKGSLTLTLPFGFILLFLCDGRTNPVFLSVTAQACTIQTSTIPLSWSPSFDLYWRAHPFYAQHPRVFYYLLMMSGFRVTCEFTSITSIFMKPVHCSIPTHSFYF